MRWAMRDVILVRYVENAADLVRPCDLLQACQVSDWLLLAGLREQ